MIVIRMLAVRDWEEWRAMRLAALTDSPQFFGATLAEWQGEGDTEIRWRTRLSEVPFNVVADVDGNPAGMVSATPSDESGIIGLLSMWVAPFARGQGVGDALIDSVVEWAQAQGAHWVTLHLVDGNERAAELYRRNGFTSTPITVDRSDGVCELMMERRVEPKD